MSSCQTDLQQSHEFVHEGGWLTLFKNKNKGGGGGRKDGLPV